MFGWIAAFFLVAGLAGCTNPVPAENALPGSVSSLTCSDDQILPAAFQTPGPDGEGRTILPGGRVVTPAGSHWKTSGWPIGLVIDATGQYAYLTHNGNRYEALVVLDLVTGTTLQTVSLPSTYRGLVLSTSGDRLFVGGGYTGQVLVFEVLADHRVSRLQEWTVGGYVADLALSPDQTTLYALSNNDSRIHAIDVSDGSVLRVLQAGTFPYDILLSPGGNVLYVSNLASGSVMALDALTGEQLGRVTVEKNPEGMALSADGSTLYVANSDSDSLSILSTAPLTVTATVGLSEGLPTQGHGSPNGVALAPDGSRVFVSEAGLNRIRVIDVATRQVLGAIPTGWYPTELVARPDGLYALSSKGLGQSQTLYRIPGILSRIPYPDQAALAAFTEQADQNNRRSTEFFAPACAPESIPVLSGADSPIRHVVLIVRENKTYDMVLGDLPGANGDPDLVVFGTEYTPNLHALAADFVNLDNYYSNPEGSIQGHQWTTMASCNDYVEKVWMDQLPLVGWEPASLPEADSIFDACFANGVSFRNYGEFAAFSPGMFSEFMPYFDNKFPFFNMDVPDVDKAAEFVREMDQGIFERFTYICLPNDHTFGLKAGKPSPESMVADNDRATARVVEAISHSIAWPHTAIFIIEDDPQGSGDHVDAHRSIAVVVSPWVRRGYVSSVQYDVPSLYRTIGMILGLPPLGNNDALATPMTDIWVDGVNELPDYTPYDALPVSVPDRFNPDQGEPSEVIVESAHPDGVEGLGMLLWRVMRGDVAMPPYAKRIDR